MACENLIKGLTAFDCVDAHGGTTGRVILLNFSDIDQATVSIENGAVKSLGVTKKGVVFQGGPNNSNVGSFSFTPGTYGGGSYSHTVEMRDFKGGPDAYVFLKQLKNSSVVAIVETKFKGSAGECKYTIYGLESGLVLTTDEGTTEMSDGVLATLSIATGDGSSEPNRPINFFTGDLKTTQEAINDLISAS